MSSSCFFPFFSYFLETFILTRRLYDKMCEVLLKLMSRFLKKSAYESMHGSKIQDVDCGRSN